MIFGLAESKISLQLELFLHFGCGLFSDGELCLLRGFSYPHDVYDIVFDGSCYDASRDAIFCSTVCNVRCTVGDHMNFVLLLIWIVCFNSLVSKVHNMQ